MKRYKILMTEPATDDLVGIAEYISKELQEPVAARKLVSKIKNAVMSLAKMPTRYATVSDAHLAAQGIRKLPVENYIVFCTVSEQGEDVTVIRILYGKRDWEQIL